jgi:choline dehydrogenase
MGPATDSGAVVDDQLRVHGLQALRIIDASVMPMLPSANTFASTIAIAEKGADLIKGKLSAE